MKNTKHTLILIFILLSACSPFNQKYFMEEAFGFNLKEAAFGKETKENCGLLIVYNVGENDKILEKALLKNIEISAEFVPALHNGQQIGNAKWGSSIAKLWKSFDGYQQLSIYYPSTKILVFGYFTSYGG